MNDLRNPITALTLASLGLVFQASSSSEAPFANGHLGLKRLVG
jgi:hypothetical protein